MRTRHTRIRSTFAPSMLVFAGLVASGSAASAGDHGVCVTASVPEAFTLPDGQLHAAGKLTLCMDREFNPVVALHRMSADGDGTTLVMSRRSPAGEFAESRPVLLFRRAHGAALDLVGYVVPFDHTAWKYTLKNPDGISRFQPKARAAAPTGDDQASLMASNRN